MKDYKFNGFRNKYKTSNKDLNSLLSSGGMYGMLNTIWLIICFLIFGGIMEVTGLLGVYLLQL